MLASSAAEAVVGIQENKVGVRHRLNHPFYPFGARRTRYRNSVEYGTSRPDRKTLKRGNTRLCEPDKLNVQLLVKSPPRRLALVFNMAAIGSAVVPWKEIPGNSELAIVVGDGTKEGKLQVVRNI